jgi:hypothetical protein
MEVHMTAVWKLQDAKAHFLTLVTRNVKDFEASHVPSINPWENR